MTLILGKSSLFRITPLLVESVSIITKKSDIIATDYFKDVNSRCWAPNAETVTTSQLLRLMEMFPSVLNLKLNWGTEVVIQYPISFS